MSRYLARMHTGLKNMDLDMPGRIMGYGVASEVVGTGVGMGTSYLLGQVHSRYRDKEFVQHLAPTVGIGGKVLAVLSQAVLGHGFGAQIVKGGLSEIGQAGLNAWALSKGIEDGMEAKTGQKFATAMRSLPGNRETILGDIPPAPRNGRFLDRNALRNLQSQV